MTPPPAPTSLELLLFDIDGTLTDATTTWGGPDLGWLQTYSTRDGEALKALQCAGWQVAPLSRNRTACASARITGLGFDARFLGVDDKPAALSEASDHFGVPVARIAYVGDGPEDTPLLRTVGYGVAVADADPLAVAAADLVLSRAGGSRAVEELVQHLLCHADAARTRQR